MKRAAVCIYVYIARALIKKHGPVHLVAWPLVPSSHPFGMFSGFEAARHPGIRLELGEDACQHLLYALLEALLSLGAQEFIRIEFGGDDDLRQHRMASTRVRVPA